MSVKLTPLNTNKEQKTETSMQLDQDTINFILAWGGGSGGILVIALLVRKLWKSFIESYSESKKIATEVNLYEQLNSEIKRLSGEISTIKIDHESARKKHREEIRELKTFYINEKDDLLKRIDALAKEVHSLKRKNDSMRAKALDAYSVLTINNYDYEGIDDLKETLLTVVMAGSDEDEPPFNH